MPKAKAKKRAMPISAVTGRIVTKEFATKHPSKTVVMHVPHKKG